jgi:dynein heavy chain
MSNDNTSSFKPSLSSRLYPEDTRTNVYPPKPGSTSALSNTNNGSGSVNALKARVMMSSQSTPALRSHQSQGVLPLTNAQHQSGTKELKRKLNPNNSLAMSGSGIISTSKSAVSLIKGVDKSTQQLNMNSSGTIIYNEEEDFYSPNNNSTRLNTANSFIKPTNFLDSLGLSEKELHDLNHVPNTFYYLCVKQQTEEEEKGEVIPGSGSVYDLQVVSQDQVDKMFYFTISKEGVTQFRNNVSQFTSLTQWTREYKLFFQISNIQFFKLYKRWKNFTVWRRGLRIGKLNSATEDLESNLFLFNPPLRRALLQVRSDSQPLAKMGLLSISLPPGEVFNIDKFLTTQGSIHSDIRRDLDTLSSSILKNVRAACDEVVDQFLKANNIAANHKMTFMERAALRAECRRLTRFLRLIDIMNNNFLKSMVQDAVEILRFGLEAPTLDPRPVSDALIDFKMFAKTRDENGWKNPLFRVVANFKKVQVGKGETDDNMTLTPTLEQLSRSVDSVINDSLDVVSTFINVLTSPDTEMYAIPDNDDGESEAVEPMDLATSIKTSNSFSFCKDSIHRSLRHSFNAVRDYCRTFDPYRKLYFTNEKYSSDVSVVLADGEIESFQAAIVLYKGQIEEFASAPRFADVGILFVDSEEMKSQMSPSPLQCLKAIQDWLPNLALERGQALLDQVEAMNPILSGDPNSVENYVNKKKVKDNAVANMEQFKDRQSYVRELVFVMDDNAWPLPDTVKALMRMLKDSLQSLESNVVAADTKEEEEIKKFSTNVTEEVPKLVKKVTEVREQLDHAMIGDVNASDDKVIKFITQQEKDFANYKARAEKLQEYQGILKLPVDEFESLDEVGVDLNLKSRLWKDKVEWSKLETKTLNQEISSLDITQLERELAKINKTVFLSTKGLPTNKVVPQLKAAVEKFNPVIPLIQDLLSPVLKERHWTQINALVGFSIQELENPLTFSDVITMGISSHQEAISVIATSAQQESILEELMGKVTGIWDTLEFDVRPYKEVKDLYILGDTSEVVASLDDSLVTINTVLGSRYVGGIRSYVDTWRAKLMVFQETLDEWLMCQRNWMYLETIFGSADIIRQLPGPAKTFQAVDKSWKSIMKQTNDDPNALKAGTHDKFRLETFRSHNNNLDQIQKDLEDYLETKRMGFPRFYFLSNDELLEILSQSKDPRAVQPHLRKCFDNLIKLEFSAEEGSTDILAMFSGENEKVMLGKNLKARGNVEEWLTAVESRMKSSLHGFLKAGLYDYDQKPRDEWISHHPGQVVATVAQMTWARDTEAVFKLDDPKEGMKIWSTSYKAELQKLIQKIRGDLTKLVRNIIVALVTTDVHARDIIDELIESGVESTQDFLWQQQLRYYWMTDVDDCIVNHSDAKVNYGFEYMGATSRLVITPLTDRCWLTLTGSYALKLGAAPAGPAGTGKTESSKDLAKAIAIQCVVFNCSDQIDYKMMGKLFRGLAQSGSWICLDEFNRIDIEVLSVIAQQLLVLREGRTTMKEQINFMGITIPLVDHHVIITMNPGYAGRTELPDNLAVCFRPVSMMVPNYALIAEIMLFAEGFGDAKTLSTKMCKLYILCSEQLSQQPHYDYGLRAVKSVLVMAGGLKRSNPELSETLVLIRALRDSNVPKFLADDLPLFAAIVQDLFPGVEVPANDYGELEVALREEILKAGLQEVPQFIAKVIQMFDIFNIRFGATIVGPAGAGKSSCYQILAALMGNLRDKGVENQQFQKVNIKILNPKCISMGELYGEFHPLTQEWHDGLASSIMREYVAIESDEKRWTVFDGPIDALWIENMNTVLDDNMTLCLANGQRIKLKSEMKCLFEVNDLAVASPATVSRIGVVYMTPSDLGWFPYVQSWLVRDLPSDTPVWATERIAILFEKVFSKGMFFQRKYGNEPVVTADIQLVISVCKLFESLFHPRNGIDMAMPQEELQPRMDKLYFFSYIWGVGAPCNSNFWEQFDENARDLFEEMCPSLGLPGAGKAFDYFVDIKENRFRDWAEIVEQFHYNSEVPYFSLMVPTGDTCRFSYVMKKLIDVDKPCFITGVTGTGKTVAVQTLLNSLQPLPEDGGMGVIPIFMNFSAQTKSSVAQLSFESKLEKKRKNLLGAPAGRRCIVFVDDVNMPLVETYGAQAPVELFRQFLDYKGFYDRDKLFWKDIQDCLLFVGAAPPGGGRAVVTPRFTRHFNVMCVPPASESVMTLIFSNILSGFLSTKFEPEVKNMCAGAVAATIEVYNKISEELLPTPAKFHYTFNLRDISKVFQGVLMIRPRKCTNQETFVRLWVHESMRIFYDRLINVDDQLWYQKQMVELCSRHLKLPMSEDDLFAKPVIFSDFLKPDADPRYYEDCRDLNKLTSILVSFLDNYNAEFPTQMNLIFFMDAMSHASRIIRILRQPRGNAMLIGVGGMGKQSLTKIASFVGGMSCLSIEINRGYGIMEFREDIKKFMIKTGVEGQSTVFLFTDTQIVDETMLEDLNNILNTGEVANLFPQDETDKIISDMMPVCKECGIIETRDNCLALFVSRVRDLLHIVLCMSPVGDALRIRCRQFPSLINCTTIDWFHAWPEVALVSVANRILADIELPDEKVRSSVVQMCGFVHRSIETTSETFFNELRRRVYTTPKSYLDLISLYMSMLKGLQDVVEVKCDRMKVGVQKLFETNEIVDALRGELVKLEPILKEKSIETEALLIEVGKESADAKVIADKVSIEEAIVGKQAAETKEVADDAQRDLDRALPALESAVKALKSLTKADITEVKSFSNPPNAVRIVMEAICVLMGEKESWDMSKKLLGKSDFMESLTLYDKDNIPEARLKKLRKNYINLEEMQPEFVKKVSSAGYGLCMWARAMDVYADVAKEVAPKKARLEEMNAALAVTMKELKEKQDQVKIILDKVALLQKTADETLAEKNRLQGESDTTAKRLVRAEKLTNGLNSEGERWKQNIVTLSKERIDLIGDCFLSCACISYYGGFTGIYRDGLIATWLKKAAEIEIPASKKFSLANTLGNPVQIREWQLQGLPTDSVSVNNAILVDKCRRWPLMIDPQMQANKWIRKMDEANDLQICSMRDSNLLRILEKSIRLGKPFLIEDLTEMIEPALEPVLQKAFFKNGARILIRLGDTDVDYDAGFKLYMTTKMPNPHYLPEVSIKVTLINFTVTMRGLESQLLGEVVKLERPDIEVKSVQIMLQMADDKKQLQHLEEKILQMLSESEGNILDDEVLINTLSESKLTSIAIAERVSEAEITEQEINDSRDKYTGVATRGSIIYFVIADLAAIDPMYQYSLEYYSSLFQKCISVSEKSSDLQTRIDTIIKYSSEVIYTNICRGLFEKDKLLFSSCVCFQILRNRHEIHDTEWNLFLRGPGAVDAAFQPANPWPDSIPQPMWDILSTLEQRLFYVVPEPVEEGKEEKKDEEKKGEEEEEDEELEDPDTHRFSNETPFKGLCASIKESFGPGTAWGNWMDSPNLMEAPLPEPFNDTVNPFQRLCLIKGLREDKLQSSIAAFVGAKLGKLFGNSPPSSIESVYSDMDCSTPCIFILSSGADPTGMLLRFAKKMDYGDRLHIVSLGQGQGPTARALIENGCKTGDWVVLQNCMLAKSWMNSLDAIIADLQEKAKRPDGGGINPDFRLYLTSSPASYFPVSVLQNGIKMTNEPPQGFRANIVRTFTNLIKPEDFEGGGDKASEWKKLLCGLLFFHANVQERRKFGPLGWNIRYNFDESDLETSIAVLRRFLEEQDNVPWDAINFATGHINYGGRVTDDWDRRCLMNLLSVVMTPKILDDTYKFSQSGLYYSPPIGSLSDSMEYFEKLPHRDEPEVFGMHMNANVTFNTSESLTLMASILYLQPRASGGGSGKTTDEVVVDLANVFAEKAPEILDPDDAGSTTFVIQENGLMTSLAICLEQEMIKFNKLINGMQNSLKNIKKAINGMIVMDADLDAMYTSFLNNQLPGIWEKVSFASLKTLGSWVTDLIFRVSFLRIWLLNGQPATFPLPVFFFPQGFMTASLQTFARKHMEAIDGLSFEFEVLRESPEDIKEGPEDGVILYGLYLEGARFCPATYKIVESTPGKMYDLLPAIHFKPAVNHKQDPGTYATPVYKTAVRKGVLSTTGMSTNFVVPVELPMRDGDTQQQWVLGGVAALLNLTD